MATFHHPAQLILRFYRNSPRNPVICAQCPNQFLPARPSQRFCSKSCGRRFIGVRKGLRNGGSFRPSQIPWNKGKTGEQSHSHGRKQSDLLKAIMRQRRGELSSNWKGGVSTANELARRSAAYKDWRRAVFVRDDYTCQSCGDRARKGHRLVLHADHIQPFALYPELRFEVSNGRTLCLTCHVKTPTYGNGAKQACTGKTAERLA